jgi:MYXO-CTERM domain-containing protein
VETGLDANGDGALAPAEVQSHHTVCNGAPATSVAAEGGSCSVDAGGHSRGSRGALASLALLGLALVRRRRPQR